MQYFPQLLIFGLPFVPPGSSSLPLTLEPSYRLPVSNPTWTPPCRPPSLRKRQAIFRRGRIHM